MTHRAWSVVGVEVVAEVAFMGVLALLHTACTSNPRGAAPSSEGSAGSAWVAVSPRIRVNRAERAVEFDAVSVIETGFLEDYVCTVGTREHESLFAFDGKASEIHAALLLAGCTPGAPGRWREVEDASGAFAVEAVPPRGDAIAVGVRMADGTERTLDWFVRRAPVDDASASANPPRNFVFGGSRFHTDRRTGIERYVADGSGSLVGLVTFGDETISPAEVIPDQAGAATPVWEVDPARIPGPGTKVTIVVRPIGDAPGGEASANPAAKEKRPGRDKASDRALPGAT